MPRKLGSWLGAYARYTDISEAPLTFDFWTGVATIAGALRRQVYIDEIKFKIFPNFYVFLVAPPGVATKSTTVSMGMKLLRQVDGIVMGPSNMTWQGLVKGLQNAKQMIRVSPPEIIDPLAIDYIPQSAITCEASELGTLLDMRDGALSSVLIALWDGSDAPFERWLATRDGEKIENPLINIIGSTTPAWLSENFGIEMVGGGLLSRIVFVYGDKKRRFIPYISDLIENKQMEFLENNLVHDLKEIAKLRGEITITREAKNFIGDWYFKHWTSPEEHLNTPRFDDYRARKFVHIHKLATILSVSDGDSLTITLDNVVNAFNALYGIEADMLKVLDSVGKAVSSKYMDTILALLKVRSAIEYQSLWRACMNSMSQRDFGEAVDGLVKAGMVIVKNDGGIITIRARKEN